MSESTLDSHASSLDSSWPLGVLVAYGFPEYEFGLQLQAAKQLGCECVELLPKWSADPDPREAARQVADAGLRVHSTHAAWDMFPLKTPRLDLASTDPELRCASVAETRTCLEFLAAAGGRVLVVHPGVRGPREFAARRAALEQSLAELLPEAIEHEVVLAVENLPPGVHPGSDHAELAEIVDRLADAHVGLCLDTGHANLVSSVPDQIRKAGHRLKSTHVHDNHGTGDEHLMPGFGMIDWEAVGRALAEVEYRGVVMLECLTHLRDDPSLLSAALVERLVRLRQRPKA